MKIMMISGTIHYEGNAIPAYMVNDSHPALVQAVAAVAGDYEAILDPSTATIRWGSEAVTPDNYESVPEPGVKAFAEAIYTFNDGQYRDEWLLIQSGKESAPEENLSPEEQAAANLQRKLNVIDAEYERAMADLVKGYPEVERETWRLQEAEARAWTADNSAVTPHIDSIITESGEDKAELVATIIGKANYLTEAAGRLNGIKRRKRAEIIRS